LGFSKGATQTTIDASKRFDDVAFAGMRPRLAGVLKSLGCLDSTNDFDSRFTVDEKDFAFASLLRCSLSYRCRDDVYRTSGALVTRAFKDREVHLILKKCATRFLRHLPERLRIIVMLGCADTYIQSCTGLVSEIHPDTFRTLNPVAYRAGGATWVHVAHPSPANGHFQRWLQDPPGSASGNKRTLAQAVVMEGAIGCLKGRSFSRWQSE